MITPRERLAIARVDRTFDCVVAADLGDGIGLNNDLPWPRLKGDLRHFRDLTTIAAPGRRNAVIMGRKTWDSVPVTYRPLPGRLNLVISRGTVDLPPEALLARSFDDALTQAAAAADLDQIFVIGGGEIYREAFAHDQCRDVVLTRIDARFACDAYIPDVTVGFERIEVGPPLRDRELDYRIERWRRRGR